jgi:hypothetical protein
MNRREFTKRTVLGVLAVTVPHGLSGCVGSDSVDNLPIDSPNDWTGVLNNVVETIKKSHILPWRNLPEAAFDAKVDALRPRLATLDDGAAMAELMMLVASLADGHTSLTGWKYARFLPLAFETFSDGVFVSGSNSANTALVGHELIGIGGKPVAELLPRVAKLWSTENDSGVLHWGSVFLSVDIALRNAGVNAGPEGFEVELRDPNAAVTALKKVVLRATLETLPRAAESTTLPKYRQSRDLNYWVEYLPNTDVIYLRYRRCLNSEALRTLLESFERTTQGRTPRAIILDTRSNEGGDSSVISGFIGGLRSQGWDKRPNSLYLLSDRVTFSAGMDACLDMVELGAQHYGEAPSQRPNFLGNFRTHNTPRDGVVLAYPTRVANRVVGFPSELTPNERILASSTDHFGGRDPVLARVLSVINGG